MQDRRFRREIQSIFRGFWKFFPDRVQFVICDYLLYYFCGLIRLFLSDLSLVFEYIDKRANKLLFIIIYRLAGMAEISACCGGEILPGYCPRALSRQSIAL